MDTDSIYIVVGNVGPQGPPGTAGVGVTWNQVTATSVSMLSNNGYVTNNGSRVLSTLPVSPVFGDIVRIAGQGAGGWQVLQNAGQVIHFEGNSTTVGTGGSLSSETRYDCVELLCIIANTDFLVISSSGNITGV